MVETWIIVSGGSVGAVCSPLPTMSRYSAHLHALARSVASAVLNVVPEIGAHPMTASEVQFKKCLNCVKHISVINFNDI